MKPEPSELVLRGCRSLPLSPPLELPPGPRRFLKKSSKNSSNGEPGGNCGIAPLPSPPPLASTVGDVVGTPRRGRRRDKEACGTQKDRRYHGTQAMTKGWDRTGHVRSLSKKT